MPRSIIAEVNPLVFKWLRESSGWTIEDVSKRLKTSDDVIRSIESGKRDPTLMQLKELSKAYKRPLAAFLLPAPQPEKPRPKDYRMLPHKKDVFDKKTILILRKARMLQEISGELSKNINYETKPSFKAAKISDDPKSLAEKYRLEFEFTVEKQTEFRTSYEVFTYLRDRMEDMNILVFQDSMPVEDARGFALPDETPNVIVLSSKDPIEARIFTLMHEFAHVLLGQPAIDFPDFSNPYQNKMESWCNQFSSNFLLSDDIAESIFKANREDLTETQTLNRLSRKYKVSKGMLLFKMLKYDFITESEYMEVLDRYRPKEPEEADEEDGDKGKTHTGGIPADVKCLSMVGNKFVSLVANNYDRNHITYTDALNYLSIKSRNFDKVLAKAGK